MGIYMAFTVPYSVLQILETTLLIPADNIPLEVVLIFALPFNAACNTAVYFVRLEDVRQFAEGIIFRRLSRFRDDARRRLSNNCGTPTVISNAIADLEMQNRVINGTIDQHVVMRTVPHVTMGTRGARDIATGVRREPSLCLVVTGPNMGGKSTLMRQLVVNCIVKICFVTACVLTQDLIIISVYTYLYSGRCWPPPPSILGTHWDQLVRELACYKFFPSFGPNLANVPYLVPDSHFFLISAHGVRWVTGSPGPDGLLLCSNPPSGRPKHSLARQSTPGAIPTHRRLLRPLKKGSVFQELLRTIHWTDLHSTCFLRLQIDPILLENTREVCLSRGNGFRPTRWFRICGDCTRCLYIYILQIGTCCCAETRRATEPTESGNTGP
eukprot:sb/3465630/